MPRPKNYAAMKAWSDAVLPGAGFSIEEISVVQDRVNNVSRRWRVVLADSHLSPDIKNLATVRTRIQKAVGRDATLHEACMTYLPSDMRVRWVVMLA